MNKSYLSLPALILLNVALIGSLKNTSTMAEYGLSSIFYYFLATILFFIPVSLVTAELASSFPNKGGIFQWTSEAFGEKIGFIAVWLQWMQSVIWFPTVLSFAASTIAFVVNPNLALNNTYVSLFIFIVYWIATIVALQGLSVMSFLAKWGVVIGTFIPAGIIIFLAFIFLNWGNQSVIPLNLKSIFPHFSGLSSLVLIIGTFLSFTGMEVNSVHIKDIKNPAKTYPKAVFFTIIIVLFLFIFTTLSIAVIVPQKYISLTAGVMETVYVIFHKFNIIWAIPIMALLITLGILASVITWIAGPSRGLFESGKNGFLPKIFHKINKQGIQSNILLLQGIIVTILCVSFLFMKNVGTAFFLLTALEVQLYILMYVILFLAVLKLRKSKPNIKGAYQVPFLPIIAAVGIVSSFSAFLLGFIPPSQLDINNGLIYISLLAVGIVILGGAPVLIYKLKKTSWSI